MKDLLTHSSSTTRNGMYLNFGFLLVLWVDYFIQLELEWSLNEQYHYGYLVPVIAAYLIFLRWEDRVQPSPCLSGNGRIEYLICVATVLFLVPHHIIAVSNPDWRVLFWLQGAAMLATTVAILSIWGGRTWILHYFPAIFMLLFAVPWLTSIEQPLVLGLMRMVAFIVVDLINMVGIVATPDGTNVTLANGVQVGIVEACSGVRSLQSSIMAAYFLGELFRFTWKWRIIILLLGVPVAVFLNLCRTMFLTLKAYQGGEELLEYWHDTAGNAISIVGFVVILLIALVIRRWNKRAEPDTSLPVSEPSHYINLKPVAIICALFLMVPILPRVWFALHDESQGTVHYVSVDWDQIEQEVDFIKFQDATKALLRFSEGKHGFWKIPEQRAVWQAFFFVWDEGLISSFAGIHNPEVCLPSAGITLVRQEEDITWKRGAFEMNIRAYEFEKYKKGYRVPYYVFFAVWDNDSNAVLPIVHSAGDRIMSAWDGKRIKGRRQLEVIVVSEEPFATVKDRFLKFMDDTVVVEKADS